MSVYLADKAEVASVDSNWRVVVSRTDTKLVRNLTLAGLRTAVRTWDGATAGDVFVDGAGAEDIRKTNLSASADPTSADDAGAGYRVGSRWINTITGKVWEAVSVATLAAIWKDLTATTPPGGSSGQFQINDGAGGFSGAGSYSGGVATLAALAVSDLTATGIPVVGASGRLTYTSQLTFVSGNLTLSASSVTQQIKFVDSGLSRTTALWCNSGSDLNYRLGMTSQAYTFYNSSSNSMVVFDSTPTSPVVTATSRAVGQVGLSINLASGQTADAVQVTSFGGTAGNLFKLSAAGDLRRENDFGALIHIDNTYSYVSIATAIAPTAPYVAMGHDLVGTGVGIGLRSVCSILWSNSSTALGPKDLGLKRNAAGVGESNTGTAGVFADWIFRSLSLGGSPTGTTGDLSSVAGSNISLRPGTGTVVGYGGAGDFWQFNPSEFLSQPTSNFTVSNNTSGGSIFFKTNSGSGRTTRVTVGQYGNISFDGVAGSSGLTITNSCTTSAGHNLICNGTVAVTGSIYTTAMRYYNDGNASNIVLGNGTLTVTGNLVFDTSTGNKIGTSVSQKIAFWNATPIVQPSADDQVALINNTAGTYDGTLEALPDPTDSPASADALRDDLASVLLPALRNNFTDLYTQVAAVRTALVNAGLMKGAA